MLLNNKREDPKMRKTYQKPYIDILYVDVENLLAESGGGKTIVRDDPDVPGGGGSPSTNIGDLDGDAMAKGGSFWDAWDSGDTWEE